MPGIIVGTDLSVDAEDFSSAAAAIAASDVQAIVTVAEEEGALVGFLDGLGNVAVILESSVDAGASWQAMGFTAFDRATISKASDPAQKLGVRLRWRNTDVVLPQNSAGAAGSLIRIDRA